MYSVHPMVSPDRDQQTSKRGDPDCWIGRNRPIDHHQHPCPYGNCRVFKTFYIIVYVISNLTCPNRVKKKEFLGRGRRGQKRIRREKTARSRDTVIRINVMSMTVFWGVRAGW
jgi:hypothetical protein